MSKLRVSHSGEEVKLHGIWYNVHDLMRATDLYQEALKILKPIK